MNEDRNEKSLRAQIKIRLKKCVNGDKRGKLVNHSVVCWTDQGLLQMYPHIVTTGTGVFEMTLFLYLRHFLNYTVKKGGCVRQQFPLLEE